MTVTNDENDEIVAVGYWKRRLQLLGLLLVLSPMILRIPLVSNFIKDVVLLTINEATPYHIEVENCLIRPAVLGLQLDNIVIDDASQTLLEVESVFVGVKIPWDGLILRTLIVDSPKITVDLDLLPEQPKTERTFEVPALPRVQVRSGTVHIVSKTGTVDIPNINLTHTQGRAQLWIEENALIESGDRKILISPFQWNDIVLENGDAWIQDINVESSVGSLFGNFGVEDGFLRGAVDSALDLSTLELHSKWDGKGYLYATVKPSGDVSNPKFGLQLSGNQFSLTRQATTRTFTYQFDSLNSQFLFKDGVLWIENLTAGWAGGQSVCTGFVDVGNNDAQFKVIGQRQNLWELGQDLDLSSAPWLEMQLDSELTLSGTLNPLNLSGDIAIEGADFGSSSGNIRQKEPLLVLAELDFKGAIQLSKTTLQYQLDTVRLQNEGSLESTGKIEGVFEFPAPNNMIVDFDFSQLDLTTLKPLGGSQLGGVAKGGGRLEGPMKQLSLTSRYHVSNFSMLGLSYADSVEMGIEGENLKELTFDIDNAQKGASTLTGTMLMRFGTELWMEGQFDSVDARANNLMGIFFDPLDVDAVVSGRVNVSGVTSNLHVEADFGLSDVTLWGEPFDSGRFRLSQDAEQLTIEEFSVERNDGLGSAWMRGTRKDGINNFEVIVGGLPVEYLTWVLDGKYPVRGKVDFLGTIRGEGFIPNGRLRIRDMWHGVQPLGDANLLLHSQSEGMVVQGTLFKGVHIEGLTGFSLDEDYIVDVQLQDFPVEAITTIVVGEDTVSGLLNADGQIWQRQGQFGGSVKLDNASLSWKDRWLKLATSTSVEWDGVQGRTSPIHILGSGKTDLKLYGEKTGHRHLVEGSGTLDMSVIEMVLEGTERASGVMNVAGEWTEEGMDAELKIENGFLQGSWFPHPIESIYSDISMLYEDVQIRSWDSVVGGGTVSLVGTVDTEEFLPSQYNLELSMNQSRIQLLDWLPPVVGSGDFRVAGDAELPLITGSVVVSEMTFVDRIGWEGALLTFAPEALTGATEEELEPYFEYAIDFTAQDTIRIRNNLADMSASASLKFVGNMASPGMLGSITLTEGGRVLFKERDFDVLRGTLRYEDASTFDPLLDIALETSVITPEREVEIRYFITGLYSDWQTHTASTPALPQADINALLLFGMTRRELETEGGLGAALAIEGSDLVFSKFGASQRFVEVGSGIFQSELLRLDRVDIVSGPTDRNSAYVSSALRLLAEKDIGNGTLRLEQNITDTTDVFVSWEQRLTQRLYTRLYWSSLQQGRTINGNGAVGAEFEVQWELD